MKNLFKVLDSNLEVLKFYKKQIINEFSKCYLRNGEKLSIFARCYFIHNFEHLIYFAMLLIS